MRKLFGFILTAMVVVAVLAMPISAFAQQTPSCTETLTLYVGSQATGLMLGSEQLDTLQSGEMVTACGYDTNGLWMWVITDSGQQGWVLDSALVDTLPSVEVAQGATPPSAGSLNALYSPPDGAAPLGDDEVIGFFFVLNEEGPQTISVPPSSHAIVAAGHVNADGQEYPASGEQGNTILFVCEDSVACTYVVDDYVPGHVGVTVIFRGAETPENTAVAAARNQFNAPNCGGSGCNTVFLSVPQKNIEQRPFSTASAVTLPSQGFILGSYIVQIVGVVPEDAQIILGGQGHQYELDSPEDAHVSRPEGGFTLLLCEDGCSVDDNNYTDSVVVVLDGTNSDGMTPADLNGTFSVSSGDDVLVVMVYQQGAAYQTMANTLATSHDARIVTLN